MLYVGGIIFAIIIIAIIYFFENQKKPSTYSKQFNEEIEEIVERIKNNRIKIIEDLDSKINICEEQLIEKKNEFESYKNKIDFSINELESKFNTYKENLFKEEQSLQEKINIKNQNIITDATRENEQKLQLIQKEYENKIDIIKAECEQKENEYITKMKNVSVILSIFKKRQQDYINRFKKDEEVRIKQDYYHIAIDEASKSDIVKLKNIAEQLSKPIILYKLIYETYYKVKMEELFKRVLGENANQGGIYKITNIKNQKVYIGRTTKFLERWRTHSKRGVRAEEGTSNRLYQFMWEEGLENFGFEVLEVCSKEEQSAREKYWISFYKSDEWGYNSNCGG